MAVKIGLGGITLLAIFFGIMWYWNRRKRKEAEAKVAELTGEVE